MKKHRIIKAMILIIVMFFHSFVLVPRANATTWEGLAGRIAFRAVAPSVIAALGSGTALVVGAVVAGGIGYLVYKSGAVTALKSWLNTKLAAPPVVYPGGTFTVFGAGSNHQNVRQVIGFTYQGDSDWYHAYTSTNGGGSWTSNGDLRGSQTAAFFSGVTGGIEPSAAPTIGTDYVTDMATTQPNFGGSDVFGSPGVAAAIVGGAAIVSAITMSDSDADKFIAGIGGSASAAISDTGSQAGSPSVTDNTVTAGDSAQLTLLQQIMNFVSNLVGIKTSVDAQKLAMDNVVVASQSSLSRLDNVAAISQSSLGRLDNIATISAAQSGKLDNIATGINTQTTALNDTKTAVQHLDNTISAVPVATVSTVATRINALKTAASTKFPFSLAASVSVNQISQSSTYAFGSLPLTPSISIDIAPMAGPLSTLFTWIRQLLVWFFWTGTLLAMLRKGMEM